MPRMPDAGDVVDDVFRVESVLAEGSYGAIYRVQDTVEDRTLALKVQKTGSDDPEKIRGRFEREARLLNSLDHPNVVDLLYYGETDDGLPYMAMEFLVGNDLARLFAGDYDFDNAEIRRIALETLSGLAAAHELGIVHRDMKPANIFLVDDGDRGHVKVLDFGFAKAIEEKDERKLTAQGMTVGTPAYVAPEMVHKENVGPHSDLYGLGLILGEMIAGERLIQISNVMKAVEFQASIRPVELPEAVEHSPFGSVVQKAVRKDPEQRYDSAEAMMEDLREIDPDAETAELHNYSGIRRTTSAPFGDAIRVEDVVDDASAQESIDLDDGSEQPADSGRISVPIALGLLALGAGVVLAWVFLI